MAQCEYCEKKPAMGNQIETRGKAKYLGGVGTKVTGISRREFKPNLQRVKITTPNGTTRYARVCTRCIKKGVVRKAVQQAPFKLPVAMQKLAAAAKAAKGAAAPAAKGAPKAAPAKADATKTNLAKSAPAKPAPGKPAPDKGNPPKGSK